MPAQTLLFPESNETTENKYMTAHAICCGSRQYMLPPKISQRFASAQWFGKVQISGWTSACHQLHSVSWLPYSTDCSAFSRQLAAAGCLSPLGTSPLPSIQQKGWRCLVPPLQMCVASDAACVPRTAVQRRMRIGRSCAPWKLLYPAVYVSSGMCCRDNDTFSFSDVTLV